MATSNHNLSDVGSLPKVSPSWTIGVVTSSWNEEITSALRDGAIALLKKAGVNEKRIHSIEVPGSYELPLGAQWLIDSLDCDAVVCLGSVVRGETPHFDFVCQAVAQGVKDVSLTYNVPVIFGVLTDDNLQQAKDRSGGKHGNKGVECAAAALKMLALRDRLDKLEDDQLNVLRSL